MFRSFVIITLLELLFSIYGHQNDRVEFQEFTKWHNKIYNDDKEETLRYQLWRKNMELIRAHNREADNGQKSFYLKMNRFGDLNDEEWTRFCECFSTQNSLPRLTNDANTNENNDEDLHEINKSNRKKQHKITGLKLPKTIDWRKRGYVTGVKDQAQCGSCWAFSAVGTMEGANFKKTRQLKSLSEQQLVDCSKNGNEGCNGGWPLEAIMYVINNTGINPESLYPYKAVDQSCQYRASRKDARMYDYRIIPTFNELALQDAIAFKVPVSVAIQANNPSFRFYSHGVYFEPNCSSTELDHAVTAVGYGTKNGLEYYTIKNSWGIDWGINGYILMSRNRGNNCGIATDAVYAIA